MITLITPRRKLASDPLHDHAVTALQRDPLHDCAVTALHIQPRFNCTRFTAHSRCEGESFGLGEFAV
jgi:hypothetical protein